MHHRKSILAAALFLFPSLAYADLTADIEKDSPALQNILPQAGSLVLKGRVDDANAKILATFPEASRTPSQNLMLGNVLFKMDPKTSYTLHKKAASDLPDEFDAQLEWAMEQHRAGEYAAAALTYARCIKSNPDFAPVLGLCAECLLRTGKIREAADMWRASENAPHGSLEQLESFVCDVNAHSFPDRDRAALITKVTAGNIDAAEKLVALDSAFPRDWWNTNPKADYLAVDLELVKKAHFKDESRRDETLCAAECILAKNDPDGNVGAVLQKYSYLLDDRNRLPQSGANLSAMLSAAFSAKAISRDDARKKWGTGILEKAKSARDAEMFNVAANLYLKTEKLPEIDQLGWDATADPRFATSLLLDLQSSAKLHLDDPLLLKAAKQFPENADVAGILVQLTAQAHKPLQPVLIQAIKAEYTHFSIGRVGADFPRPRANTLATYFKLLANELPPK